MRRGGRQERIAPLKMPWAGFSPFSCQCWVLSFPGTLCENANALKSHGTAIQSQCVFVEYLLYARQCVELFNPLENL